MFENANWRTTASIYLLLPIMHMHLPCYGISCFSGRSMPLDRLYPGTSEALPRFVLLGRWNELAWIVAKGIDSLCISDRPCGYVPDYILEALVHIIRGGVKFDSLNLRVVCRFICADRLVVCGFICCVVPLVLCRFIRVVRLTISIKQVCQGPLQLCDLKICHEEEVG